MVEEWLALVILGCATATFGVMVGTGGGVIFVPMLLILFDFDPEIAAGTSLTLVALNSFAGTYTYTRLGFVDVRSGILFAVVAIPGSIIAPFAVAKDQRRPVSGPLRITPCRTCRAAAPPVIYA